MSDEIEPKRFPLELRVSALELCVELLLERVNNIADCLKSLGGEPCPTKQN